MSSAHGLSRSFCLGICHQLTGYLDPSDSESLILLLFLVYIMAPVVHLLLLYDTSKSPQK